MHWHPGFHLLTLKNKIKTGNNYCVAFFCNLIEMMFSGNIDMEQVCVVGSGFSQPVALITLSETGRRKAAEEIEIVLKETLLKINNNLDAHEKLDKVVVMQE